MTPDLVCPDCGSTSILPAEGARRPDPVCLDCMGHRAIEASAKIPIEAQVDPYDYKTEPDLWRPPVETPDAHHTSPLVVNGRVVWQQQQAVHTHGAQYTMRSPRRRQNSGATLIKAAEKSGIVTPDQAEAWRLRSEGYSRDEIAEYIGISKSAVKERLKRADEAILRRSGK